MVIEKKRSRASLRKEPEFIVDGRGRKKAVVLTVREYEELLEDLHDLSVIAERLDEPRESFEEVKRRLRDDGLLPG
jgi:PHD/YefM family antitoxin component YafN of YafNO toxin-antitoxin module